MTPTEKALAVPDSVVTTAGTAVTGFLLGMSAADIQTYLGIGVGLLTAAVLIQRMIINHRTIKRSRLAPSDNSE